MNKKELIDKQELIDELAKYVKSYENAMDEHGQGRYGAYEVSLKLVKRLNESKITDEQAWNKVAEAYPESAQSLRNTLDNAVFGKTGEPQKLILPKCAEQWIEGHCAPSDVVNLFIEVTCATDSDGFIDSKWRWSTDFYEWLANDADTLYILCDALRYGYEVEKEPLYEVIIGDLYLIKKFNNRNDFCFDTSCSLCAWEKSAYQLTEAEIKAIDERYWPFAVPVEEVVEG
ncbi:TPA: DUF1642 domain-containing protein [Enterococcus faecium]|uniref:DUF1642 domain-containing protein n=1 Tax=Enterococcus faecium TaxID=1352 RepID=UPI00097E6DF0|nr:DUF1642 domain-containing protein [Enterococcus faecium]EGP5272440.1 DUF1642 domain-containing protein [Enterococcus faecium]ONN34257.1 hypothetical protein BTN90_10750 [Enterococcus faecium]PQB50290.1 DUF1642 domain-containing protein [Enterococcus faecium]PQD92436.1 DUF1642 domain-containing protein [Enterococcus faecium]RBT14366.1 hypothetical protein EA93_01081 [Enterococcus faecium]